MVQGWWNLFFYQINVSIWSHTSWQTKSRHCENSAWFETVSKLFENWIPISIEHICLLHFNQRMKKNETFLHLWILKLTRIINLKECKNRFIVFGWYWFVLWSESFYAAHTFGIVSLTVVDISSRDWSCCFGWWFSCRRWRWFDIFVEIFLEIFLLEFLTFILHHKYKVKVCTISRWSTLYKGKG